MINIVSFMPTYAAAPTSLYVLEQDIAAAAQKINALDGTTHVLMPAGHKLVEPLRDALNGEVNLLEADPSQCFVYCNDTACMTALRGQVPVPAAPTGMAPSALRVLPGCELLTQEGSTWIWFDGADKPVNVARQLTVSALIKAAEQAGVAAASEAKAVYVGYPSGQLFSAADGEATVDLASSYVRIYSNKNCMAQALSDICAQYRKETCGRCVFGHEGSHQINQIMLDICHKKGKAADIALIQDLASVMQTQCLCEMGQIMATTVLEFFKSFGPEIEQHFSKKVCPAGECSAYMTFHILPSKCMGCGECLDVCEEEAILGKPRFIHVIDQKACTQCGDCVKACDDDAIIMAGAEKPRTPPRPLPIRKR